MSNKHLEILAAIDIGSSKIVTIVCKNDVSKIPAIIAIDQTDGNILKDGLIQNIEDSINKIKTSLSNVQRKLTFKIDQVIVGIPAFHTTFVNNHGFINLPSPGTEININDIADLTKEMCKVPQGSDYLILELIPQSYSVDDFNNIFTPIGMCGRILEGDFLIPRIKRNVFENVSQCMAQAGLTAKKFVLQPIAAAEAVLTENDKFSGSILVDIGSKTTSTVIYKGRPKKISCLNLGGDLITKEIKDYLSIDLENAEKLKYNYGGLIDGHPGIDIWNKYSNGLQEISTQKIQSIFVNVIDKIIDFVINEINNSVLKDKLHNGIVITGGSALIKGLDHYFRIRTGFNTRIGYPNASLLGNDIKYLNHPSLSTSIGLIIKNSDWDF